MQSYICIYTYIFTYIYDIDIAFFVHLVLGPWLPENAPGFEAINCFGAGRVFPETSVRKPS